MSLLIAMPVAALLAATGIYNPQLMHNGRCMAEPSSFHAFLYCTPEAPPHGRAAR